MATNAQLLVEARAAYHAMMIGGAIRTVVDQNGERVEYSTGNPAKLLAYIAYLEGLIAAEAGLYRPKGPAGVIFS